MLENSNSAVEKVSKHYLDTTLQPTFLVLDRVTKSNTNEQRKFAAMLSQCCNFTTNIKHALFCIFFKHY